MPEVGHSLTPTSPGRSDRRYDDGVPGLQPDTPSPRPCYLSRNFACHARAVGQRRVHRVAGARLLRCLPVLDELPRRGVVAERRAPVVVISMESVGVLDLGRSIPWTVNRASIAAVLVSSAGPAKTSNLSGTVEPFFTVFSTSPMSTGL